MNIRSVLLISVLSFPCMHAMQEAEQSVLTQAAQYAGCTVTIKLVTEYARKRIVCYNATLSNGARIQANKFVDINQICGRYFARGVSKQLDTEYLEKCFEVLQNFFVNHQVDEKTAYIKEKL